MRITPDTNVLVRAALGEQVASPADARQGVMAAALLEEATLLAITLPSLCEFVWVLRAAYRYPTSDIAEAIRRLCAGSNVMVDRQSVAAGLAMMRAGGDFADGVIAHQGATLGGDVFCSFDRKAVKLVGAAGFTAREP